MVRLGRIVAPGIPHPITQRGNRRQETCSCAEDHSEWLGRAAPLLKRVGNWEDCLSLETSQEEARRLRSHERTGRPLGDELFTGAVESQRRRTLRRGKLGPQGRRASLISMVFPELERAGGCRET